jgi:outer membrane protein TolC
MRSLIVLIATLLSPFLVWGQLQFNNLREVLQYGDEHGAAALQAKLQPQIAREDVNIQASGLYPRVNAFSTADYYPIIPTQVIPAEVLGGPAGTYYKAQFGLPYIFTAGAELSMPLVNLEKWAQLSRARAQYHQAQWSAKASLENYHIQLMQAYYQALVTKAVRALNMENQVVADELLRIITERKNAGVLNPSDYNRSVNLQLEVRSTGINFDRSLAQALTNLNSLLNLTDNTIELTDSIQGFNWPLIEDQGDISSRPAMQEANMKLQVAELSLSESKKSALPKLALNSRYTYNAQSKLDDKSRSVEFNTANVGLRVDVPVFQGNYYRSSRRKSELLLQSAKLELQRTTSALTQQQADWFNQYKAAYSKQSVLQQRLNANTDNMRIARLNLKEGVMELDEFNNIFTEYNRARMDYIQNLADGILYYLLSTQKFQ